MWWCTSSFWGGPWWCWCRDFWGGRWSRCSSATWKMSILPQFWTSDTHEVTRRLPPAASKFAFYHSFERLTRTKWRKGRSASLKICILPKFWASDTHEVTRGSLGQSKHLHFTRVLSVRHARSDERVVKSTGAIPAPRQKKEYILTIFQRILISLFSSLWRFAVFSLVFSPVFHDSHHFSRTLGSLWWQSLKTAITSAELWAVFDDNLYGQPSLQRNFGQSLMTIFMDSHHFSRTLGSLWWQSLKDSHHFSGTLGSLWWQSLKDSHHFSGTLGSLWWQSLWTAITSAELWAVFDDNL